MSTRKQRAQAQKRQQQRKPIRDIVKPLKEDDEDYEEARIGTDARNEAYRDMFARSEAMAPLFKSVGRRLGPLLENEKIQGEQRALYKDTLSLMNHINHVEERALTLTSLERETTDEAVADVERVSDAFLKLEQKWRANETSCGNMKKELVELRSTNQEQKRLYQQVVDERDALRSQMKQLDSEKKSVVQLSAKQRRENAQLLSQHNDQQKVIARLELCETRPCPICLEEKQPSALVPCGHTGCRECLTLLPRCHICRAAVTLIIDLYL